MWKKLCLFALGVLMLWGLCVGGIAWLGRMECGAFTWTQIPLFPFSSGQADVVTWDGRLVFLVLSPDCSEPELEVGEGYLVMHCLSQHSMWTEGPVYYVHEDRYALSRWNSGWKEESEVFTQSAYEGAPNFLSMHMLPDKRERFFNAIRALEQLPTGTKE